MAVLEKRLNIKIPKASRIKANLDANWLFQLVVSRRLQAWKPRFAESTETHSCDQSEKVRVPKIDMEFG